MKFSIVVPVAPERNAEIVEAVNMLDYPKSKFELIVIKGTNPSENRNRGAVQAKGKYIVFLDDDGKIEKDYLKKTEEFLEKNKDIDIVGGPQLTPADDRGFAKISGYALSSKFGAWKIASRYSLKEEIMDADETSLTSANLICKKSVFEKIKFDPNLFPGEDPKFIADAKRNGLRVAYSPEIIIYHRRRAKFRGLLKQIFNYGKVRPLKEKFSETIKMPFFFIPSLFVLYLIFLILAGIFRIWNFYFFVPLLVYIILSLGFGMYDSIKNKDYKAIFILVFIYPIIHISYGVGMIYGYLKKL